MESDLIRKAKECFTKQAWEQFFIAHGNDIRNPSSAKYLTDLFRLLRSDQQSLQYDPEIWATLIEGCMASWNLDLATEIVDHVKAIPSARTALRASRVYAEKGRPLLARQIANRALRLTTISALERLQLEMLVCQSYVDEGKRNMAIRMSNRMRMTLSSDTLSDLERGQFLQQLARTNFFLGRYNQAGSLFYDAYLIFAKIENWYEAARSVYNAGSSYFSAGGKTQDAAFELIEQCRRISEQHHLPGPLSHVEAFYGHDDYWHGDFAGARDHYQRAHKYIPTSDQSFRTLHVLSMLSLIYFRTGQWTQARRFGDKTLKLAERDHSERFRSRYDNLRAELLWESGDIEASQAFLRDRASSLASRGVNTLEELSTLSRFYWQSSKLREEPNLAKFRISDQLRKNTGDWVEYLHSLARVHLGNNRVKHARELFEECLQKSRQYGDKYHVSLSLLGIVQCMLTNREPITDIRPVVSEFEISLARLVETPIKVHTHFIRAAIAYRLGQIDEVKKHLKVAQTNQRIKFCDSMVLGAWMATIEGHSYRVSSLWQKELIAGQTRIYFAPSLKKVDQSRFIVSDIYEVNLQNHPALNQLLTYLLQRNRMQAMPQDIQSEVWKQSLKQQGWRQKIRNSIFRLRELFPTTIAPLLIHEDHIELNSTAISIEAFSRSNVDPRDEILRLLREGPMSTVHLSNRLNISAATTKRILQKLHQDDQITVIKIGRQVTYQAMRDEPSVM